MCQGGSLRVPKGFAQEAVESEGVRSAGRRNQKGIFFPDTIVPNFPNFYFAAKKGIELRLSGRRRSLLAKLRTVGWVRPSR